MCLKRELSVYLLTLRLRSLSPNFNFSEVDILMYLDIKVVTA